jgi:hypothetical protein
MNKCLCHFDVLQKSQEMAKDGIEKCQKRIRVIVKKQ